MTALATENITPAVAKRAIFELVKTAEELPTVAAVLSACRRLITEDELANWTCPECGSELVIGFTHGTRICGDCEHKWVAA